MIACVCEYLLFCPAVILCMYVFKLCCQLHNKSVIIIIIINVWLGAGVILLAIAVALFCEVFWLTFVFVVVRQHLYA